ncbi:uncharacterized protein N7458_003761 [Penicillium daleae]|uniref:Uncharacterized protein n=1 Tax=Penicillium daleae TaxID=63821 RepID=A0AAD6G561_9EURO|nr:uncharacterized protein N7458_003761 [Penicillium daleae]KAJ5455497.1 hypothetical protein N7458_003761 [Penicillium daleae]
MKSFELLQYNVLKSWDVMASFPQVEVQEPWRNGRNKTTHQPAIVMFQLLYSETSGPDPPGFCWFVPKKGLLSPRNAGTRPLSMEEHWISRDMARAGQTRIQVVSMNIGHDELLRQKVAAPAVARLMIDSGLLEHFQTVDSVATRVEKGDETWIIP